MSKCKICGIATNVGFNINLKLVNICDPCANQIAYQEIRYMFEHKREPQDSADAPICGGCGLPLKDHHNGERCPSHG